MQVGVLGPGVDGSGEVIFQIPRDQVLMPSERGTSAGARVHSYMMDTKDAVLCLYTPMDDGDGGGTGGI